ANDCPGGKIGMINAQKLNYLFRILRHFACSTNRNYQVDAQAFAGVPCFASSTLQLWPSLRVHDSERGNLNIFCCF
ncbi:MAG: hypothetical protein WAW09_09165, partial [Smithella sp.]